MTETLPSRAPAGRQPRGPRLPEILGPWETAVWLWRRLRRMSTALMLLFALAAASLVATFIPQDPVVPQTVAEWRAGSAGPGVAVSEVFDALELYDVFGSWWFTAFGALLFVSLTGCLVPRWAAFAKVARRRPVDGRNLQRLSNHAVIRSGLGPEQSLAAVDAELRRQRYRRRRVEARDTSSGRPQVAAERGHWREGGSLIFHSAFYVLLIGIVIGQGFGFTGQVNVPEGGGFTDTRIDYDLAEPGRWFGFSDHTGARIRLDDFDVGWFEDGTPSRFVSTVTVMDGDREVRTEDIEVNHPLRVHGIDLYQMRFGMAPRVVVRAGEEKILDEQVMLSSAGAGTWRGQAKVSTADPQILLDVVFLPNAAIREGGGDGPDIVNRGPQPRNPVLFADLWVGDLGLERPLPPAEFDREGGDRVTSVVVREGERVPLLGGRFDLTLEFRELTMWSGFQVSHSRGRAVLLASAGLILAGLLPSLYAYRRRIWAEARPSPNGSEVLLAGVALQRKPTFADEFERLTARVRAALGDDDDRERDT